jgi:hypothetical protein
MSRDPRVHAEGLLYQVMAPGKRRKEIEAEVSFLFPSAPAVIR